MTAERQKPLTILKRKQVEARCALSCSTIYLRMAEGTFPKQIRLGPRAVGWVESEISKWIESRVEQSRGMA